ncbi:MAG: hypothetical protein WKG03_06975, partial [Telluria sp.]
YTLNQAGNLGPEGVSLQALYSKFKELWLTATYQPFPFPMYVIDAEAGKYQIGTDGDKFSGWKPSNDATRNLHRDGGWEEYDSAGTLARVYVGILTLGSVGATDQLYYQRQAGAAAVNFVFPGAVNEGVQVYGNATNGSFDTRTVFNVYCRIQGKKFDQKKLNDSGYSGTGPRLLTFAVQNETDLKIATSDATIAASAPFTSINVTYYGTDQNRTIGGTAYPFRTIINGANATAEQIYAKVQYLLRQSADIDNGAGTVPGKTADSLLSFVGDKLVTAPGVYIDNFDTNDTNRIDFYDKNGIPRTFPFVAAGTLAFNTNLTNDADAKYRMFFKVNPGGNYGTAAAITVNNAAGVPITGTIGGAASIPFDFAYDSNVQGGRAAGADAVVVVVAIGKAGAKPVTTEFTLSRAVGQRITLVAEKERSYANPA